MRIWLLLAMAWDSPVWAQSAAPLKPANAVNSGDVLQWMLALLVVLMIFFVMVWVMRRAGNWQWPSKQPLQIIASLPLGVRERLVVVNVGEKQLLLGVTSGRIDKLLELEGEQRIVTPAPTVGVLSFAQQLQNVMSGRSHE